MKLDFKEYTTIYRIFSDMRERSGHARDPQRLMERLKAIVEAETELLKDKNVV